MRTFLTLRTGARAVRLLALAGAAVPAMALAAPQQTTPPVDTDPGAAQQLPPADTVADANEVVVTGSRAAREQAIERKRALPVIADVVASDDIGKLPDFNTAEAVQRLPGVSVEIDQGEPRYVVVRGIDPNLNQVTVDGNIVGIPEAEGRRVALNDLDELADVATRTVGGGAHRRVKGHHPRDADQALLHHRQHLGLDPDLLDDGAQVVLEPLGGRALLAKHRAGDVIDLVASEL